MNVSLRQRFGYHLHAWRRGLGNLALFHTRHCHGQLLSMHQSGTHWLKFMLANALSHHYGTPAPVYNHANDIIGGPRDPQVYPQLPRLLASHTSPHPLLGYPFIHQRLHLPRYVVLVRDLRAALASNYVKWQEHYQVDFSTYLRGDVAGRRYNSDLWWALRFLNTWGEVLARVPARVMLVRYEDLQHDTAGQLARVAAHFALDLPVAALAHAIGVSDKASMLARADPARPAGAVRVTATADPHYTAADRAFIMAVCAACLRHPCGYDYSDWSRVETSARD